MSRDSYSGHTYTWRQQHFSISHQWSLVGPKGGLSFNVTIAQKEGQWPTTAGLEIHYARGHVPEYLVHQAPSHKRCWLLGEPCWHDGTSLYATETLWPIVEAMLKGGDHESVFRLLESEANNRFLPEARADGRSFGGDES